ncbi:DegV family protein [Mycoplasma enhydrae]|uniref:DegV family protein n=1 Tax=Mycoplasma enhydrae TaxID=2499220 RepID=UPI00197BA8EF|nr:DegV family protein [Mycoplasma enhydrae]MBN4089660.1 DegV family protein [Mycoplasma enhydrae]MCV3733939.1 DegV family protein [Mycoplasma enhydrae]MCV3753681.1 DegV family protein [Mycoplasma enhydrae]
MKIKIIVDSSCGLNEAQANEMGWGFIPLQAEVEGKTYQIGKDILIDDYVKLWKENRKIDAKTSASSLGYNEEVVAKYLNDYDKIIIYPISKFLSSQTNFLTTQFQDNDKVFVVQSKHLSFLIFKNLLEFEQKIKDGVAFEEACEIFEKNNDKLILIPQFNDALVKGGRLSKSAAAIAKLLRIVPILKFDNGILEKEAIGRIFSKSLEKVVADMWKNNQENITNKCLLIIHSGSELLEELTAKFKNIINNQIPVYSLDLPVDIAIHTGVGAVCTTIIKIDPKIESKFFKYAKKW